MGVLDITTATRGLWNRLTLAAATGKRLYEDSLLDMWAAELDYEKQEREACSSESCLHSWLNLHLLEPGASLVRAEDVLGLNEELWPATVETLQQSKVNSLIQSSVYQDNSTIMVQE